MGLGREKDGDQREGRTEQVKIMKDVTNIKADVIHCSIGCQLILVHEQRNKQIDIMDQVDLQSCSFRLSGFVLKIYLTSLVYPALPGMIQMIF